MIDPSTVCSLTPLISSFVARCIAGLIFLVLLRLCWFMRTNLASSKKSARAGLRSDFLQMYKQIVECRRWFTALTHSMTARQWLTTLSPAYCAMAVFGVVFVALYLANFFTTGKEVPLHLFRDPFLTASASIEMGARAIWAISAAAVWIASILAIWIVGGFWASSATLQRQATGVAVLLLAGAIGAVLTVLGWTGYLPAFGSAVTKYVLDDTWSRIGLCYLGPLTDGMNVIGLFVPALLALGACLLLIPPTGGATQRAQLQTALSRLKSLDKLLYIGAFALMVGIMEVVSLMSWAATPYHGTAEIKTKIDICKSAKDIPAPVPMLGESAYCRSLLLDTINADDADDFRRFVRALAITFGAGFSALLASLYLSTAYALQARAFALVPRNPSRAKATQSKQILLDLGIETDLMGKLGKIAATLGPLAMGILSGTFGV